jgi:hypothetical protein
VSPEAIQPRFAVQRQPGQGAQNETVRAE